MSPPTHIHAATQLDAAPDITGDALQALERAVGASAPPPRAALAVRERELVILSGAGLVLYSLALTPTRSGWEQRLLAFPPAPLVRELGERARWATGVRELCLRSPAARTCRVPVGVVAAEARGWEEAGEGPGLEDGVYDLSLSVAAIQRAAGARAAKAGRALAERVEQARRPSHVPLRPLQLVLAEEVAFGRSLAALCSRSEHFARAAQSGAATSALCRGLGLQGTRVGLGELRYARVAPAQLAEALCAALDMAPEEVGL
jgi:hypothetical protein